MKTNQIMTASQANSVLPNEYSALSGIGQQGDSYIGRGAKQRTSNRPKNVPQLIGAIDQGTSSTRFLVFENQTGHLIASSQMEIKRITPKEGWVEIDPSSIMSSVHATIANVYDQLILHYGLPVDEQGSSLVSDLLSCIGICNQRESTVVWDSKTGEPLYNVLVWMDNRTKYIVDEMIDSIPGRDLNRFKDKTGLPMSTYFSAFKLKWLMDNVDEVRQAKQEKRLLFGTVDTWILWNLTGGKHLTDVTNASRTFLMDIETLQWDKSLCKHFKVPMDILPQIRSSADDYGRVQVGPFCGTPITGVIGDQSAALFGHNCLQIGQTKATFGTGCFIMQNIGPGPLNGALSGVHRDAKRGLVTTVAYKLADRPACYALEGSIKIAGAALTWLRDNIQLIQSYEECDILVNKTTHSAGVFFVPALGGLYSPYWDPNAAGIFIGLSQFTRREHLVRATFDSIAFQTNDILSLMRGVASGLMIDGGLCKSDNLCQILADITGYDIIRPAMCETSALGAAMVAAHGAGLWTYESMLANSSGPLDTSLNHHNRTHHYPPESLHYDSNKYHSSNDKRTCRGSSDGRSRARSKSMTSNEAAARHRHSSTRQNLPALVAANQQCHGEGMPKSAHGVNDDAGGGEEGDRGGGGGGGGSGSSCYDDTESATSSSQVATISTTNSAPGCVSEVYSKSEAPVGPPESFCGPHGPREQIIAANLPADRARANLTEGSILPASSGYSSGDNFEQAASLSGVSARGRVDTPMSQLVDSLATHVEGPLDPLEIPNNGATDFNLASHELTIAQVQQLREGDEFAQDRAGDHQGHVHGAATDQRRALKNFPFNLKNFFARQREVLETAGLGPTGGQSFSEMRFSRDSHEAQAFGHDEDEENDDNDEDLVHEFGGRDSYGEDGYDSSNASVACSDDEQETADQVAVFDGTDCGLAEEGAQQLQEGAAARRFAGKKSSVATRSSDRQKISRRQRRSSALSKQVDVFQSYISLDHRTDLVNTWRLAVERSMQWTKVHHEEVRRIDYQRLSILPISMYLFLSIGMVALSGLMSTGQPPTGL